MKHVLLNLTDIKMERDVWNFKVILAKHGRETGLSDTLRNAALM